MKIDKTTVEIINRLKDGRTPFKKIADDLSLAEGTVRSRVKKLKDEGILEITGLVDPEAIPGQSIVMIGVKLNTMDLVGKGEEISKLKGVVSVCVVTGRFDLVVTTAFKKGFGLLEFYTEQMSKVGDVQSVETFVVYKAYNLKVPCEECSI
ncbi:MAG: Lrp/AsnC family transcriptional regulator [Desulfobacterales bacterium]|nr:Lrp/AsnC family transcriptional regulator [Desulfobacterales bacterium]MCP4162723.1 Lrp/AsnC family transcriptional regulator [Deltaproteobacteria bacterium]